MANKVLDIKLQYQADIRRRGVDLESFSLLNLVEWINSSFELPTKGERVLFHALQYTDEDGDLITLCTEMEWKEAKSFASQIKKCLRILIVKKSGQQMEGKEKERIVDKDVEEEEELRSSSAEEEEKQELKKKKLHCSRRKQARKMRRNDLRSTSNSDALKSRVQEILFFLTKILLQLVFAIFLLFSGFVSLFFAFYSILEGEPSFLPPPLMIALCCVLMFGSMLHATYCLYSIYRRMTRERIIMMQDTLKEIAEVNRQSLPLSKFLIAVLDLVKPFSSS